MYAIFKSLELIIDMYIYEDKKEFPYIAYWKESKKKIDGYSSTENKINQIIEQKLKLTDQNIKAEIKKIVCSRNYSIHTNEKTNCRDITIKNPNETHILRWFEMLFVILRRID